MEQTKNTWWVEYTYDYDYPTEDGDFEHIHAVDAERFHCLKKKH